MADMGTPQGFYEDDEPLEELIAAFERGEHGVTRPPVVIDTVGLAAPESRTATFPAKVSWRLAPIRPISVPLGRGAV